MEILQKRLLTVPSGYDASLLMHFDGDLKDSSRNNHIASITAGSQYFSFSAPDAPQNGENFGRHLYVSAGNGRIQIPHHESLALGKIWQIDFRLRVINTRDKSYFSINKPNNFSFRIGNGGIYYSLYNSLGELVKSSPYVSHYGTKDSFWLHFCFIFTGTQLIVYKDAQLYFAVDDISDSDCVYGQSPITINRDLNSGDYRLDELRIIKGRYEIPTEVPTIPYR